MVTEIGRETMRSRLCVCLLSCTVLLLGLSAGCSDPSCVSDDDCFAGEQCIDNGCKPIGETSPDAAADADEEPEDAASADTEDAGGSDTAAPDVGSSDAKADSGASCTPGASEPCYTGPEQTRGVGECSPGMRTCNQQGEWQECLGETTPRANGEFCGNQKDDDCDMLIDEECPCNYEGFKTGVCAGAVTDGNGNCAEPDDYLAETDDEKPKCDQKDNDCDGDVDEGCSCRSGETQSCYSGGGGTKGVGICKGGTQSCSNGGTWGDCNGEQTPKAFELCNGKDDDCDKTTDEAIFAQLSLGAGLSCARTPKGQSTEPGVGYCWGSNKGGRTAQGTGAGTTDYPSKIKGAKSKTLVDVAAGRGHACALTSGGNAACWGENGAGQLGNGGSSGTVDSARAVTMPSGVRFDSIYAGEDFSCALDTNSQAYCWGDNHHMTSNSGGILGVTYGTGVVTVPTQLQKSSLTFESLAAGRRHLCGLPTGGGILCWGVNDSGETGVDPANSPAVTTPNQVSKKTYDQIVAGDQFSCALQKSSNAIYCWGSTSDGRLGEGTTASGSKFSPVKVQTGAVGTIAEITAGQDHACLRNTAGQIHCWGANDKGQLGDGTTNTHAAPIGALASKWPFDAVAAGGSHTCGLTRKTRQIICWGANGVSQLTPGSKSFSKSGLEVACK